MQKQKPNISNNTNKYRNVLKTNNKNTTTYQNKYQNIQTKT